MLKLPFKKLMIWEKGIKLTKAIYKITKNFPKEENYGLTSQIRRSSISIPSNIAEGSQRKSDKEFANFILIAKGSLAELETQIILSKELEFIIEDEMEAMLSEVSELDRMLFAFHKKLTPSR